ncbi:MAG: HAD-IIA family hydrolase [Candidatus Lokiarchaeota archaeon]|nr:HAD-IIA family hydrolase [Candidatus Lokiarchaeota archaeon]
MRELIDELKDIELVVLDMDGVVYRGKNLIPNADKVIEELNNLSIKVVYNTNNSTRTRQMYVERLKKLGIKSEITDFYTSASITASEITKIKKNSKIFIIGEIGLKTELEDMGHIVITEEEQCNNVDFVIVGLDRDFNYQKLAFAQQCILVNGAKFIATNSDATLPAEDRMMPGAGVMVNAVKTCTNIEPMITFGKPNPFGIIKILEENNVDRIHACMIGDRLNTDILAGNKAGIKTIAVLTGVTTREEIDLIKKKSIHSDKKYKDLVPDLILDKLYKMFIAN